LAIQIGQFVAISGFTKKLGLQPQP